MSNNFTISEFIINKKQPVPLDVVDKILKHHIPIAQSVRDKMNCPLWPSQNSGYRSVLWEKNHGRSGTSQHCFKGKGAVDYTCANERLHELFDLLCKSKYMRICLYHTFIHCDYNSDTKQIFRCDDGHNWLSYYG